MVVGCGCQKVVGQWRDVLAAVPDVPGALVLFVDSLVAWRSRVRA